jgi:hypothetical protein
MDWLPHLSLPTLSLAQLLQRLVAAALVLGVHGWAAAVVAERLGDPGPRYDGRRTLNPLAHLDFAGLLHAIFFRVAWMPRLDVDPAKLRWGVGGGWLLTLGASLALALLSVVVLAVRSLAVGALQGSAALTISSILTATAEIAITTAVFHLLPLPPFVGAAWAPWGPRVAAAWKGVYLRYAGVALVAALSLAGVTDRWAGPLRQAWRALLGY